jgi:hypoxanthine-DNA glycosylase
VRLTHPWGPEYSSDSKLLILGTFPSPRSREMGYYYGHPQNMFWKTLAASMGMPEPPYDIEARRDFVRAHGIALWDVFKSVDIEGASDASIHDAEPNTFKEIISDSGISAVFTTGRTGTDAFNRLCSAEAGMRAVYLPSTSPANRRTQATREYEQRWSLVGKLLRGELVSSAGMKELDRKTIEEKGVPSLVLMERAALAAVGALKSGVLADMAGESGKAICVCGAGNNGGDGFAIARLLRLEGIDSEILFIGDRNKMSAETKRQALIAENYGVPIAENDLSAINKSKIIVDALFGIGLVRELSGVYLDAVQAINKARKAGAYVLAVDVPSGISADTGEVLGGAAAADETVTFAFCKIGLTIGKGLECSGKVDVADIGIYHGNNILNFHKFFH